jgi:hypothetical protein
VGSRTEKPLVSSSSRKSRGNINAAQPEGMYNG